MKRHLIIAPALLVAVPLLAADYKIDAAHSTVAFKVKHMVVSKTAGRFQKFSGDFSFDPKDVKTWKAKAVIDTASIDTNVTQRDEHLRSPEFFDVQKFPTMEFASTKAYDFVDSKAKLDGLLTLHGVTKPVTLEVEFGGAVKDLKGNEHVGFTATGRINRKDFGITWNRALEAGGLMVGEDVDIALEIEGIKKS